MADNTTKEDILSELKINPVVMKNQNYRNKWLYHVWQMDRHTLPRLITNYQNAKDDPSKDFWTVYGTGTGHEA
jgi:hypothetical protein